MFLQREKLSPFEFYVNGGGRLCVAATSGAYTSAWQPRPQPTVSKDFLPLKKYPHEKTSCSGNVCDTRTVARSSLIGTLCWLFCPEGTSPNTDLTSDGQSGASKTINLSSSI